MSAPALRVRPWPQLLWVVLAVGAGLRLAPFAANRSFWLDEAMLALNVVARPASQLLARLDYAQTAPPIFLLALEGLVGLFGATELAFRAVPLVAGLLLLPAVWVVARRFAPAGAALFAVAVVALSPILLRYAAELKPYSSDALVCVVLVGLAAWCLERPGDARRWGWLVGTGALTLWVSFSAPFVLAAVGAALLCARLQRRPGVSWGQLVAAGATWGLSAVTLYAVSLRHSMGDPYLHWYFEGSYLAPDAPDFAERVIRVMVGVPSASLYHRVIFAPDLPVLRMALAAVALILVAAGAVAVLRRTGLSRTILLLGPALMALAASAVRAYPATPRTLVFAVPPIAILLAAGGHALTGRLARLRPALAALFLAPAAYHDVVDIRTPSAARDAARAVIREVEQAPLGADLVYVSAVAIPQWLFYSTDWRRPDQPRIRRYAREARSPDGPALQGGRTRGRAVRPDEGTSLVYRGGRRPELLGLASGSDGRDVRTASLAAADGWGDGPDRGWAGVEARRIREATAGCAHLLASTSELAAIRDELRRLGARYEPLATGHPSGRGVQGARVCFDGGGE